MKEKNLNILYDHYKDTYEKQREHEKNRNKLFIAICFSILLLLLTTIYQDNVYVNIKEFMYNKLGVNFSFESAIIELFIWFIILYLALRYYQMNVNIDKNYNYLHELESIFENNFKIPITREGKNYLRQYPFFLKVTYAFYKYFFPSLFSLCMLVKWINCLKNLNNCIVIIISGLICGCLIGLNGSYLSFNFRNSKGDE